jgi:hypothetical protein|tara:strand:+ start:867 stop:1043 length:177 start_codon:yes stop_codon:yes gene_type:complete
MLDVDIKKAVDWCLKNVAPNYPEVWEMLEAWEMYAEMYFICDGNPEKIIEAACELDLL